MQYKPTQSQLFKKLAAAGLKTAPILKRRSEKGEPELFFDHVTEANEEPRQITPIKVRKVTPSTSAKNAKEPEWAVLPKATPTATATAINSYDPLNPDSVNTKAFFLVHRLIRKTPQLL